MVRRPDKDCINDKPSCPKGHILQTFSLDWWEGFIHDRQCDRCKSIIPRNIERWHCAQCDTDLCPGCHEEIKNTDMGIYILYPATRFDESARPVAAVAAMAAAAAVAAVAPQTGPSVWRRSGCGGRGRCGRPSASDLRLFGGAE